jgi:nicotinate-nucleotide adenylyltransferase
MESQLESKTKVGLLFGSFNPIHIGHLVMAEMAIESGYVDVVWFVVSPSSPYKMDKGILADPHHRRQMVLEAVRYNPRFAMDDTEFYLPTPSYTYLTLEKMKKDSKDYDYDFHLICGTDVYVDIPNWVGGKEVIEACNFLVYPRNTATNYIPEEMASKTNFLNGVPSLEISATFLREQIKNGKTTKHLLPDSVHKFIKENNLYK